VTRSQKGMVSDFLDTIALAQSMHQEWVEVPAEVIAHYNRKGMNGSKYFIFQGIKVCEQGKLEEIQFEEAKQSGQVVFGPNEGTIKGL